MSRMLSMAALVAALVAGSASPISTTSIRAFDQCDTIGDDPGEPGGPGQPDIVGRILNASSSTGIAGVTVQLFRCRHSTPQQVRSTTTAADGTFGFLDLDGPSWYFVQAVLTGPLAGKAPAVGTSNPTSVIDVGPGACCVDLEFSVP